MTDRIDDVLHLTLIEPWMARQRETFFGVLLCRPQSERIASQLPAALLQVYRNRIVDKCLHSMHPQMALQLVAILTRHNEKVIDMGFTGSWERQDA